MQANNRAPRAAFTLIELLVVVAIIALLISILLPSLNCAREQAKTAKCGVQLRGFGLGLVNYSNDNRDWLPGANTTGVNFWLQIGPGFSGNDLRKERTGQFVNLISRWDWMSTLVSYDTELNGNRAERYHFLLTRYRCPAIQGIDTDELYGTATDKNDFEKFNSFPAVSYLMPGPFVMWGTNQSKKFGGTLVGLDALTIPPGHSIGSNDYVSQMTRVGQPARKVAIADGTRFLNGGRLDFDLNPSPPLYGSFGSSGAWYCGSQAYGVQNGTKNWDGQTVSASTPNASEGKSMALSYRHQCNRTSAPNDARSNKGEMNALFFDGHVQRMGDKESRNPEFWYPKGAVVRSNTDGMTFVPTDGSWVVP
jgi:prepilin-type N-terminal cleavage/methylation domain-containing protein/prepilin-type processing-associated H-X9-DG protein